MKSISSLINGFVWEHLERFVGLVDEGGEETVFEGVSVLDEPEKFVHGALVNATANLYVHYVKKDDPRAEITLRRLNKFLSFVLKTDVRTWGKLSCLRGLYALHSANLLEKISHDTLEILKIKTDYSDFYNKEKNEIISLPTNYYRVAMACAGYREMLGWDTERFSERIREKLVGIIAKGSESGWMDEEPPHGRFDRYSIILSSEFADTALDLSLEVPEFLKNNLKSAAEMSLLMANNSGDGVNYGRSLSCHGDATPLEIFSSAAALGLLEEKNIPLAVAYSVRILEKILGFWYDGEKGSFDIWWRGRSTNKYRQVHRVLEVNLDMAMHLITTLRNFDRAGISELTLEDGIIEESDSWSLSRVDFTADGKKSLFILKKRNTFALLPLIGLGSVCDWAAYMPFPAICGKLEAAPQAHMPFLVPEYSLGDGCFARPIEFYDCISYSNVNCGFVIVAEGNLAFLKGGTAEKSEYRFKTVYTFSGSVIEASFTTDAPYSEAKMVSGIHSANDKLETFGFDSSSVIDTDGEYDFKTPSGAIVKAEEYVSSRHAELGYRLYI